MTPGPRTRGRFGRGHGRRLRLRLRLRLGRGIHRPLALCLAVLLPTTAVACTSDEPDPVTLRVLADSELTDLAPLLEDLRQETGIILKMEYRGTLDASEELASGRHRHHLAWLSSDRYLRLISPSSGRKAEKPLSTSIMSSPVAIGMKPATARQLRASSPDRRISWADVADAAAGGGLTFAMADPRRTNSGLAALVGVATAAAGTGGALKPADVSCDRLNGFFSGHTLSDDSPARLADRFVRRQDAVDAYVAYESDLLALNRGGRLRTPLEIVHPQDGMMLADHPLLLLDPGRRAAYDRLAEWLRSTPVQKKIMERTLRRPVDPAVPRLASLRRPVGNALYFPDRKAVIDRLLAGYGDPGAGRPAARVLFVLDFSGSMRGERIRRLRAVFEGLGGADDSRSGRFLRFHRGEVLTVLRFAGEVLDERTVTYRGAKDPERLRSLVASEDFGDATAVWSALDHAYRRAAALLREDPEQPLTIVLMTDGENNAGLSLDAFLRRHRARTGPARTVPTYAVRYGEAEAAQLAKAARATGGRMVDAAARSLLTAFKETRGCVH